MLDEEEKAQQNEEVQEQLPPLSNQSEQSSSDECSTGRPCHTRRLHEIYEVKENENGVNLFYLPTINQ